MPPEPATLTALPEPENLTESAVTIEQADQRVRKLAMFTTLDDIMGLPPPKHNHAPFTTDKSESRTGGGDDGDSDAGDAGGNRGGVGVGNVDDNGSGCVGGGDGDDGGSGGDSVVVGGDDNDGGGGDDTGGGGGVVVFDTGGGGVSGGGDEIKIKSKANVGMDTLEKDGTQKVVNVGGIRSERPKITHGASVPQPRVDHDTGASVASTEAYQRIHKLTMFTTLDDVLGDGAKPEAQPQPKPRSTAGRRTRVLTPEELWAAMAPKMLAVALMCKTLRQSKANRIGIKIMVCHLHYH